MANGSGIIFLGYLDNLKMISVRSFGAIWDAPLALSLGRWEKALWLNIGN